MKFSVKFTQCLNPVTHNSVLVHLLYVFLVSWTCCMHHINCARQFNVTSIKFNYIYRYAELRHKQHLCILPNISWKLQVVYVCSAYRKTALLLKTFLELFRVAWEFNWRAMAQTHQGCSQIQHCCAYTASLYMYISIWCTTRQVHHFIKTMLAKYYTLHVNCGVFPITRYMYTNIKINKKYYWTSWKA